MAIEGSLESVDIQDVAQLLNINRSSGMLHLENDEIKGLLCYKDGEVINAEVEGMKGEAAAYVLLSQSVGHFHFQISEPNMPHVIKRTIHDLVLEAARRKDTIKRIRSSISHDNIVFLPIVDVRIPKLAKDFSDIELKLLRALDGQTDIQAIIEKQKQSAFEVLYVIYDLEQRGVIKRVDIFKLLTVKEFKKLFGKVEEVFVSQAVFDAWTNESMTYADCEYVEIRTESQAYGQVAMQSKANVSPETILIPKGIMEAFEVAPGDKVLVKPILNPD